MMTCLDDEVSRAKVVPPSECPWCGKRHDRAIVLDGEPCASSPGDLSLCITCCGPSRFGENLELVRLDEDGIANLAATNSDVVVLLVRCNHALVRMHAERGAARAQ